MRGAGRPVVLLPSGSTLGVVAGIGASGLLAAHLCGHIRPRLQLGRSGAIRATTSAERQRGSGGCLLS
jgi:hypothetical protein